MSTPTELYILRNELSRRKLSPTSATAHYSSPDNAIGLVAQCELSGCVKLGEFLEAVGRTFSHIPGNPATVGVVRWPSAGDTAGYRLRRPKLTPVSLISMSTPHELSRLVRYFNWCEVGRCDATWDHAFSIAYNTPPLVRSHNSTSP